MIPIKYLQNIKLGANIPADYSTCGCLQPKKMWITDCETAQNREIYVSCGHCSQCRNQRRNEWVSRMVLHSFSYRHCYLVTLTYGSYNLSVFEHHPFKEDWLLTYPVCDTHNYNGRFAWTPSLLRHEHLTKFLKRLRKLFPETQLSYVACGEYGENYGRPHFHLLVWSNEVITLKDMRSAWSYDCVKKSPRNIVQYNGKNDNGTRFKFCIGHVDFVDLVANGTLDPHKSIKDIQYDKTAKHIFSYVAKYIGKQTALEMWTADDYKYAYHRVKAVFNKLPVSDKCMLFEPYDFNVPYTDMNGERKLFHEHRSEKSILEYASEGLLIEPLDSEKTINFTYNNIYYENIDFFKFANICGPFFVSSRTYAIGKQYALENLSRFKAGNYALPEFQGRSLVFPRYFATMAQNSEYPLRFEKFVISGKSLTRGSLPHVHSFFSDFRENKYIIYNIGSITEDTCPFCSYEGVEGRHKAFLKVQQRNDFGSIDGNILHGSLLNIVLIRDGVGTIKYFYDRVQDTFRGYLFNRHSRKYTLYDVFDRIDFIDMILTYIEKKWSTLEDRQKVQEQSLELFNLIENDPFTPVYRDAFLLEVQNKQKNYKSNHFDPL